MIFLNVPDGAPGATDLNRTWTFDGPVLGVMSASNGSLEVSSSALLGAPGTAYPAAPFPARGLEGAGDGVTSEGYTVAGNSITVGMAVGQPGDWIRVITQGNRPPDCSAVTADPATLWAPNHELRTVTLSASPTPTVTRRRWPSPA